MTTQPVPANHSPQQLGLLACRPHKHSASSCSAEGMTPKQQADGGSSVVIAAVPLTGRVPPSLTRGPSPELHPGPPLCCSEGLGIRKVLTFVPKCQLFNSSAGDPTPNPFNIFTNIVYDDGSGKKTSDLPGAAGGGRAGHGLA